MPALKHRPPRAAGNDRSAVEPTWHCWETGPGPAKMAPIQLKLFTNSISFKRFLLGHAAGTRRMTSARVRASVRARVRLREEREEQSCDSKMRME